MLKLKKVAVTGGLSCGKSSFCRILEELGAYVVSSDKIVHQLLSSDTTLSQEVINLLGPAILINQRIDRSRIANLVFNDLELLQSLEALIHPMVYKEIDREYQTQKNRTDPPPLFIAEVPLLFESDGQSYFDITIAVLADIEICFKRFTHKTDGDRLGFNHRIARQLPISDKATLADYVIMNEGTFSDLKEKAQKLYTELRQCSTT